LKIGTFCDSLAARWSFVLVPKLKLSDRQSSKRIAIQYRINLKKYYQFIGINSVPPESKNKNQSLAYSVSLT